MALWHHLRRTGLQRLIPNCQSLGFPLSNFRSFVVPAHIKAKQEQEEQHGPRLNEAITAQCLRLVTDEGHSMLTRWEALEKAKRLNLDLVEEQMLQDGNRTLSRKIEEAGQENPLHLCWQNDGGGESSGQCNCPSQSEDFFQLLQGCNSRLQIGFSPMSMDNLNDEVQNHNETGYASEWM